MPDPISARDGAKLRVERLDARCFRNQIVALFERRGKLQMHQLFDWYYRDQGQVTPISWIARMRDDRVCGLCSVSLRPLRFGNRSLLAGVVGNLIIDNSSRSTFAALGLMRAVKELVTNGELDILLGIPNQLAEPWMLKMGFHVMARWESCAALFSSRDALRSRFGSPGSFLSPLVNVMAGTRRLLSHWHKAGDPRFSFISLEDSSLQNLDCKSWEYEPECFVFPTDESYLLGRFLREPTRKYQIIGIVDSVDRKLCGYIVWYAKLGRLHICDCRTDSRRLSEAQAILTFCHGPEAQRNTVWIAQIRSAPLSRQLSEHGFIRVPTALGGYPHFPLVGFWTPKHPLAEDFARARHWNILVGFNDV